MDLLNTQKVDITVAAVDANNQPAPIEGDPQLSSSDPNVVSIADQVGATAFVVSGQNGTATVTATADADLGSGVTNITGTLDFTVIDPPAPPASSLTITPGTPVNK